MKTTKLVKVATIAFLGVAVLTCYSYRIRLNAWFWQLRNHGSLEFGTYVIPVPTNWYVDGNSPGQQLLVRLDSERNSTHGAHLPVTINLLDEAPFPDIDKWLSIAATSTKDKRAAPLLRRDLRLNDERMSCVCGDFVTGYPGSQETPLSWHCKSSGGLEVLITATEPDMRQIWEIIAQIKPVNR